MGQYDNFFRATIQSGQFESTSPPMMFKLLLIGLFSLVLGSNSQLVTFQNVNVTGYYHYVERFTITVISSETLVASIPQNNYSEFAAVLNYGPEDGYNKIEIVNQSMSVVFAKSFADLDGVEELILENNGIELVEDWAFTELPQLKKLSLRQNQIKVVSLDMFDLENLRVLDLSENKISLIFDGAFLQLNQLVSVFLTHNSLSEWHTDLSGLTNLETINLGYNYLAEVNLELFSVVHQPFNLYLSHNRLDQLTGKGTVSEFGDLWLDYNNLIQFPRGLSNNQNIKINNFRINNNNISHWDDDAIDFLQNVKTIYFDRNPMSCDSVGAIIKKLPHLKERIPCAMKHCDSDSPFSIIPIDKPDDTEYDYEVDTNVNNVVPAAQTEQRSDQNSQLPVPNVDLNNQLPNNYPQTPGHWKLAENDTYVWETASETTTTTTTTTKVSPAGYEHESGYWKLNENGTYSWETGTQPTSTERVNSLWNVETVPSTLVPEGPSSENYPQQSAGYWKLNPNGTYSWETGPQPSTETPLTSSVSYSRESQGYWKLLPNGTYAWETGPQPSSEAPSSESYPQESQGHWELQPNGNYTWVTGPDTVMLVSPNPIVEDYPQNLPEENVIQSKETPETSLSAGYPEPASGYWKLEPNGTYSWVSGPQPLTEQPETSSVRYYPQQAEGHWKLQPNGTYTWETGSEPLTEPPQTVSSEIYPQQSGLETSSSESYPQQSNGYWRLEPNGTYSWVTRPEGLKETTTEYYPQQMEGHWQLLPNGTYTWVTGAEIGPSDTNQEAVEGNLSEIHSEPLKNEEIPPEQNQHENSEEILKESAQNWWRTTTDSIQTTDSLGGEYVTVGNLDSPDTTVESKFDLSGWGWNSWGNSVNQGEGEFTPAPEIDVNMWTDAPEYYVHYDTTTSIEGLIDTIVSNNTSEHTEKQNEENENNEVGTTTASSWLSWF